MSNLNIKDFPEDLHRAAKVEAAKEGIPLRTWFIAAVKERLERKLKNK